MQDQNHDEETANTSRRIVTFEQFIVDTFTRIGEDGVERAVDQPDQIGGGGTYAIIGSRMFVPPSRLGMIIDYTPSTLPQKMRDTLNEYGQEMWVFRERGDGHPTARAVNRYNGQTRGFEYLTKPLLLTPHSLLSTRLANPLPSTLHIISYPAPRSEGILSEVQQLKRERGWDPMIVWEPEEESLEVLERVARDIDLIGPNHHEVLRLFSPAISPSPTEEELKEVYINACKRLVSVNPKIGVVIRCGHLGCCYASTPPSRSEVMVKWVQAYWNPQRRGWTEGVVKDPTGAGNAFMGGLAAALDSGKSLDEGVIWGSVAASFTIEQDGLPMITNIDGDGDELWNGEDPWERVREMKRDMGMI
ncbi:hypothetical protein I302_106697 [Kwoniella bestiolae CBS 10118]|uniref:Carbohydrate kinase PfkB domain-containing protein n=1 Tax=Kwoniella bestiolae CBS 10118 TaxID=1296100 RepID=A0A1B9G0N9_9TREE|nr:hypothetical protein I302_06041 [Kwoniella bestiolae CBS 10118]OCF24580.1 hypothetical protein I302_06041 [Kwoniella bestiolae CBS 10118]